MKAIITVGISGSGKSTWADANARGVVVNRDNTRWEISGRLGWNGPNAYRFDNHTEGHVTRRNNDKIIRAALAGQDIIVADTNLNTRYRNELIELLEFLGYEVEIKEFPISFPEALRRDSERGIFTVGEAVLKKQWEQWVIYIGSKND